MNAPEFAAAVPPGGDEVARWVELLDPVVAGVDHVHVPAGVGREAADRAELAVAAAVGAPLGLERAGGGELLHDVAELVGDVHVALRVHRDGLGKAQHALGAPADHLRRHVRARGGPAPGAALGVRRRRTRTRPRSCAREAQQREDGAEHRPQSEAIDSAKGHLGITTRAAPRMSRLRALARRSADALERRARAGPRGRAARPRSGRWRSGGCAPRARCTAGGA